MRVTATSYSARSFATISPVRLIAHESREPITNTAALLDAPVARVPTADRPDPVDLPGTTRGSDESTTPGLKAPEPLFGDPRGEPTIFRTPTEGEPIFRKPEGEPIFRKPEGEPLFRPPPKSEPIFRSPREGEPLFREATGEPIFRAKPSEPLFREATAEPLFEPRVVEPLPLGGRPEEAEATPTLAGAKVSEPLPLGGEPAPTRRAPPKLEGPPPPEASREPVRRLDGLSQEQRSLVAELIARDREVRSHEAAHQAAGADLAGAASFAFQTGPDGRNYAVGGEVPISIRAGSSPDETARNARQARAAALAPANPSPQDFAVAALASRIEQEALAEARRVSDEEQQATGTRRAALALSAYRATEEIAPEVTSTIA